MKVQQQLTPLAAAISIVATAATRTLAFAPSRDSTRTSRSSSHLLHAATPPSPKTTLNPITSPQPDLTFTPPDPLNDFQITDPLCAQAASKMKRVMVPVSPSVSSSGYVGISYIHFAADENAKKQAQSDGEATLPLLLVHGFDSSALEFRRLGPQLSSRGIDVYCVDLLGWGYTQLDDVASFSAQAKIEALEGFWKTMGGYGEVVVGGASLGGAAVIEFAAKNLCRFSKDEGESEGRNDDVKTREGCVRGTVLLDAQGFVDGIGPMSFLPSPLARLGIQVLKSEPLRESANQMSYFDKEQFATEDALKVGRMHCLRDGWEEGMLSFMQSGGFRPKEKVGLVDVPSLVIWGRDDGILEKEFAQKFVDTMPDAQLQWIERCGHVPHLEQPELTAKYIAEFLRSDKLRPLETASNSNVNNILNNVLNGPWGAIGLGGVAVAAATGAAAAGTLMGGGM